MTKGEDFILRRLLWLRHGCSAGNLYGDDGEMQCHSCMLDFKRDSIEKIENRFNDITFKRMRLYVKKENGDKMTKDDKIQAEIYKFLTEDDIYFSTSIKNTFAYRKLTVKETKEKIIKLSKKIVKGLKKEK